MTPSGWIWISNIRSLQHLSVHLFFTLLNWHGSVSYSAGAVENFVAWCPKWCRLLCVDENVIENVIPKRCMYMMSCSIKNKQFPKWIEKYLYIFVFHGFTNLILEIHNIKGCYELSYSLQRKSQLLTKVSTTTRTTAMTSTWCKFSVLRSWIGTTRQWCRQWCKLSLEFPC